MFRLFCLGISRFIQLLFLAVIALFSRPRRFVGALLALLLLPLFIVLQLIHWIFWILDEIFFHRYRATEISQPVFIIGPPRTGTTFLHHALAGDPDFTTFTLWECLFGVTIVGKKLSMGLARLDRLMGRPFARLFQWLTRSSLDAMEQVHPIRLDDPEEDFLLFLPFAACFLLLVPYPNAGWLWRMARFDEQFSGSEKRPVLTWYRRCLQKHLYVHGENKTFLSKNASFGGMSESLLEEFPDAKILVTWRDPLESVPSQFSSLRPALNTFGMDKYPVEIRERLLDLLVFYYEHLNHIARKYPTRVAVVRNTDMRHDLVGAIEAASGGINLEISQALQSCLQARCADARSFKSSHSYSLEEFGLSAELIKSRFPADAGAVSH